MGKVNAPIAQPVEQTPLKRKVLGSIPSGRTSVNTLYKGIRHCIIKLVKGGWRNGSRASFRN